MSSYPRGLELGIRRILATDADALSRWRKGASGYGLFLSYLAEVDEDDLSNFMSRLFPSREDQSDALRPYLKIAGSSEFFLSGAEAVAKLLERWHVASSFAFPGTSELALCYSITQVRNCQLMNSFGDKEAVFLSAGASLFAPNQGVAILHGARGLTNALGAIADTRKNEVGTVVLVGLPSTRSAMYLPPHGEDRLFEAAELLSKHSVEVVLDSDGRPPETLNHPLVAALCSAMERASTRPFGPSVVGLPQDVLEERWVPWSAVRSAEVNAARPVPSEAAIATAATLMAAARRPVLFIDDYYLRYEDAIEVLDSLAALAGAAIYQLRYQRGAVLFERYPIRHGSYFVGWYDPYDPCHRSELFKSDLVITVEDRNMYPRVMGNFPPCQAIAITSDARKATKNGYLRDGDVVLEGDAALTVRMVAEKLRNLRTTSSNSANRTRLPAGATSTATQTAAGEGSADELRSLIAAALAGCMQGSSRPALVDDSQTFGAILTGQYNKLPEKLRVFGSHGGFVGSGVARAVGLAISARDYDVYCTLGDHALANSLQGLAAAVHHQTKVTFIVCNNGTSVSLRTQASADGLVNFASHDLDFLDKPVALDYIALAEAFGMSAMSVTFSGDDSSAWRSTAEALSQGIIAMRKVSGPSLIEIKIPKESIVWEGLWPSKGVDEIVVSEQGRMGRAIDAVPFTSDWMT